MKLNIDTVLELTRRSEGLVQGPYAAAREGFEPATMHSQITTTSSINLSIQS